MSVNTPAAIEGVVAVTVAQRLQLCTAELQPATDLRTLRSFSSFKAVSILEDLEQALDVEIRAERLRAERLCSIEALTELFRQAVAERDAVTP